MKSVLRRSMLLFGSNGVLLCLASALAFSAAPNKMELINQSGDAYVRQAGTRWLFGTSKVVEISFSVARGRKVRP
jgi:hypothetical protein